MRCMHLHHKLLINTDDKWKSMIVSKSGYTCFVFSLDSPVYVQTINSTAVLHVCTEHGFIEISVIQVKGQLTLTCMHRSDSVQRSQSSSSSRESKLKMLIYPMFSFYLT